MERGSTPLTVLSALIGIVAAVSACSSDDPRDVRAPGLAAGSEFLDDNIVTLEEYRSAFNDFVDCMDRHDRVLIDSHFDAVEQVYDYAVSDDAMYSGDYDRCYDAEFGAVDEWWQLTRQSSAETTTSDST